MKSILTLFSLAMSCIMMLSSCGKEHFPYVEESIMAGFSGAKDSLVVYDSDGSCNIFYCPSWIEATVRDSVISYTIMENKAMSPLEDCVIIETAGKHVVIPAVQGVPATFLRISATEVNFGKEGGTEKVTVFTDGGRIDVETPDSIDAKYCDGQLTVNARKNDGPRIKGDIKLLTEGDSATIHVVLDGKACPTCDGEGYVICPKCKGSGYIFNEDYGVYGCTRCGGSGYGGFDGIGYYDGKGKIICPDCKGKGL